MNKKINTLKKELAKAVIGQEQTTFLFGLHQGKEIITRWPKVAHGHLLHQFHLKPGKLATLHPLLLQPLFAWVVKLFLQNHIRDQPYKRQPQRFLQKSGIFEIYPCATIRHTMQRSALRALSPPPQQNLRTNAQGVLRRAFLRLTSH